MIVKKTLNSLSSGNVITHKLQGRNLPLQRTYLNMVYKVRDDGVLGETVLPLAHVILWRNIVVVEWVVPRGRKPDRTRTFFRSRCRAGGRWLAAAQLIGFCWEPLTRLGTFWTFFRAYSTLESESEMGVCFSMRKIIGEILSLH